MKREHRDELIVLSLIGGGLIVLLLCIVAGLYLAPEAAALPNWAENVLVALATGGLLKMGDVLSALVSLSTGRQVEGMSERLSTSVPVKRPIAATADAADAALETAEAAQDKAEAIADAVEGDR